MLSLIELFTYPPRNINTVPNGWMTIIIITSTAIVQILLGIVWYGNCLFDKIKDALKHNSKYYNKW